MRKAPLRILGPLAAVAVGIAAAAWVASSAAAQEAPPERPVPSPETRAQRAAPGFLGVELVCSNCAVIREGGRTIWRFSEPPVVLSVHGGSPADRAGIEEGDALLRIDGLGLTTEEGGRRFGDLREGRAVALVVRRGNAEREVRVVPGRRPQDLAPDPLAWHEQFQTLPQHIQLYFDSLFPQLRANLESFEVRLREHRHALDSLSSRDLERHRQEHEKWVRVYRDSIRGTLDSLWVRALPTLQPRLAPAPAPLAYSLWMDDSVAVFAGWNAMAGAQLTALTPDLYDYFPGAESGVLVLRVAEGTPAAKAGLKAGDVIVYARGKSVADVSDLRGVFFEALLQPVELVVVRKGKELRVTIRRD